MSRLGSHTAIGYPLAGGYQTVAYTGTAGRVTNGVGTQTRRVAISVTTDAHIAFVTASTLATATDFLLLAADGTVMFVIRPGQYVSAIQLAAGGTLHVSEIDA